MKYSRLSGSKKSKRSRKWWVLAGVVALAAVIAVLELTNTTHFFHSATPASKVIVKAGKPTPAPKSNSSAGKPTTKTATPDNTSRSISGATDTNGSATATTNPNQWVVAQSGAITVKQPTANATLQSGGTLSGSAKVDTVTYRLIDSSVGVISEGTLKVVNGNFSGALNFTSHSSTGRLDVFSTNAQGVELNEVQISVNFQ
jgi:hypothetical protein